MRGFHCDRRQTILVDLYLKNFTCMLAKICTCKQGGPFNYEITPKVQLRILIFFNDWANFPISPGHPVYHIYFNITSAFPNCLFSFSPIVSSKEIFWTMRLI